ncbi:unnamed protein product, partial [Tetraodon nigroviridis]
RILTTSPRHRQSALTRSLGLGRRSPPQRSQTGRRLCPSGARPGPDGHLIGYSARHWLQTESG